MVFLFIFFYETHFRKDLSIRLPKKGSAKEYSRWILSELRTRNIESYILNETIVFGVARSDRAQNFGCVCVCAHYSLEDGGSFSALSTSLVYAEYLTKTSFVGKDVIFLFIAKDENKQDEMVKRFLDSYYGISRHEEDTLPFFQRMGNIQQAIVLDFEFNKGTKKLVLEVEGQNLPNQDFLNSIVNSCHAGKAIAKKDFLTTKKFWFKFMNKLPQKFSFFAQFFLNQAFGKYKVHALFNDYAVNALTMSSLGEGKSISPFQFIGCFEIGLKNLLALQENLHVSYFFYIMANAHRFVSLSEYLVFFGMMFALFPAFVIYIYVFHEKLAMLDWTSLLLSVPVFFFVEDRRVQAAFIILMEIYALMFTTSRTRTAVVYPVLWFSLFLVVCAVCNFPLSAVAALFGSLHLLVYYVSGKSRWVALLLFVMLNPEMLTFAGLDLRIWKTVLLVFIPFRMQILHTM